MDSVSAQTALRQLGFQNADEIDLADAALWLAKWAEPGLNIEAYRRHLTALVHDAQAYVAQDQHDDGLVLEAVQQILARRYGYGGTTDPAHRTDGANLARTIDQRRGGSLVLAILYGHLLRALGRRVQILDFLPRTLVAVQSAGGRVLVDPFDGGNTLDARDLRDLLKDHQGAQGELTPNDLPELDSRQMLLRLQRTLMSEHLRYGRPEAAVLAVEGALLVAPNEARLWRELGLIHARMDHFVDAINALERFLDLPGNDAHRYSASQMVQNLRHLVKKD